MSETLHYHGPAIAPDGRSVKTIEGEYDVIGAVKFTTGTFYQVQDAKRTKEAAGTYFIYEVDYLEAQGLSAS